MLNAIFFWGVVEQFYRMRHRGIPAALQKSHARLYEKIVTVLLPLASVLLLVAARKDYNEAIIFRNQRVERAP